MDTTANLNCCGLSSCHCLHFNLSLQAAEHGFLQHNAAGRLASCITDSSNPPVFRGKLLLLAHDVHVQ